MHRLREERYNVSGWKGTSSPGGTVHGSGRKGTLSLGGTTHCPLGERHTISPEARSLVLTVSGWLYSVELEDAVLPLSMLDIPCCISASLSSCSSSNSSPSCSKSCPIGRLRVRFRPSGIWANSASACFFWNKNYSLFLSDGFVVK